MSLEIWEATRFVRVMDKSRTKPLVLECERRSAGAEDAVAQPSSPILSASGQPDGALVYDAESRLFVVKSPGHPEVLESTLFQEIFGNLLARYFGILTPAPALIALGEAFVQVTQPRLPPEIKLHPGWGVGCEHIPSLLPLVPDFKLTATLRPQAALIYAFDLLAANPDRSFDNPNCALKHGNLLAYDFECAFSFLRALFGPPPWQVSKLGIAHRHVFQSELKREGASWKPFLDRLNTLDEGALREMVKDLPSEWLTRCDRVFSHLLEARDSAKKLHRELEESLRVLN